MSGEALERAARFVAAQGSPFARLRLAVLLGERDAAELVGALAALRGPGGALATPDDAAAPGAASTARALAVLEAAGRLDGPLVEDASAWLAGAQREDGSWAESGDEGIDRDEERIVLTATLAGLLARTLCARPSCLTRAADWLEEQVTAERLQSGGPELLAACARAFTSLPSERADEILQWCGREIERAFRTRRASALAGARALLACDAMALPGARLRAEEVVARLLAEQAPDGGFGTGTAAERLEATLDAARALLSVLPRDASKARSVTRGSRHATRSEPQASERKS